MIEARTLPQIIDLGNDDIDALLSRVDFGHLGSCLDDRPYVIPIHFAYDAGAIYFYTTEGMKTDIIDANPAVCLQVEDIRGSEDWESVIVAGTAERVESGDEFEHAMTLIKKINPRLSPAWSIRWLDDNVRSNHEVVYRISMVSASGRRAFKRNNVH